MEHITTRRQLKVRKDLEDFIVDLPKTYNKISRVVEDKNIKVETHTDSIELDEFQIKQEIEDQLGVDNDFDLESRDNECKQYIPPQISLVDINCIKNASNVEQQFHTTLQPIVKLVNIDYAISSNSLPSNVTFNTASTSKDKDPTKALHRTYVKQLQDKLKEYETKIKRLQKRERQRIEKMKAFKKQYAIQVQKNKELTAKMSILQVFDDPDKAVLRELLNLSAKQKNLKRNILTYSTELKMFALTMYGYSAEGYHYLRDSLNHVLPSTKTLSRFFSTTPNKSGKSKETVNETENNQYIESQLPTEINIKTEECNTEIKEVDDNEEIYMEEEYIDEEFLMSDSEIGEIEYLEEEIEDLR